MKFNLDRRWSVSNIGLKKQSAVADPGENLTGALHSNFGRGGYGGRGLQGSWIYAMMLLIKTQ